MSSRLHQNPEVQVGDKDDSSSEDGLEPINAEDQELAKLAAESSTQQFNFEPLLTKLFVSEKDLLDTIHSIFPKGIKVCRKDKWKAGPNMGMHKKWRFVCECGGQPRRNFNGSPARRTKKIGCPFFINAFWSRTQRGPRVTTASLYHFGHEEVEVNHIALAALCQQQQQLSMQMLSDHGDAIDPKQCLQQKDMLVASLKLKMDYHLKFLTAHYPLDVVVRRVNEFLAPEASPALSVSMGSHQSSSLADDASLLTAAAYTSGSSPTNSAAAIPTLDVSQFEQDIIGSNNTSKGPHAARKRKDGGSFEELSTKYANTKRV